MMHGEMTTQDGGRLGFRAEPDRVAVWIRDGQTTAEAVLDAEDIHTMYCLMQGALSSVVGEQKRRTSAQPGPGADGGGRP